MTKVFFSVVAVQASIAANTYVVSGPSQVKSESCILLSQEHHYLGWTVITTDISCDQAVMSRCHMSVCLLCCSGPCTCNSKNKVYNLSHISMHCLFCVGLQELVPGILNQIGGEGIANLTKGLSAQVSLRLQILLVGCCTMLGFWLSAPCS